jgi:hypothetical protein
MDSLYGNTISDKASNKENNKKQDDIVRSLRCFVKLGLLNFWRSALPDDEKIIPLLILELSDDFADPLLPDWSDYKKSLLKQLTDNALYTLHPIKHLMLNHELSLSDIFILALLGEIENSYIINLVLSELQSPDKKSRPSLHTLQAMVECLFSDEESSVHSIIDFADHTLVQLGLMSIDSNDEQPLPLRKVKIPAATWNTLINTNQAWPHCDFIEINPFVNVAVSHRQELEVLATILQDYYSPLIDKNRVCDKPLKAILIRGAPGTGRHEFTAVLAQALALRAMTIPTELWQKSAVLPHLSALCQWLPVLNPSLGPGDVFKLNGVQKPLIVILGAEGSIECDNVLEIRLGLPDADERSRCWQQAIENTSLAQTLGHNALLSAKTIMTLGDYAQQLAKKDHAEVSFHHILQARRHQGAEKLRLLAEPVDRNVNLDAMILSPMVEQGLEHLILRANKRESLWQDLGKTLKATPNPGVRALLVGESGTGKTLAASYVATQLAAPLYRVDLSSIMNKYIGESEKNLAQLLDEAAANDVVLLFDEADSLFGSRSDGKENGERFANMLTNFLLTRIENHPGVVILTTNSKDRIDNAFNRRLDVIIDFPIPGFEERLALWHSHLGEREPGEHLCRDLAIYSDFTGGQIRNAVLVASVYAEDKKLSMQDIWQGLTTEYNKLGRDIPSQLGYLNAPEGECA